MILVLLAAAAQAASQPLPASPPPPESATPGEGWRHHPPRQQVFVAPSGEPFRAAPEAPYPVADWFAQANTTHDGKLTEAQFTADFVRFAATLDLNHDGVIDSAELQVVRATTAAAIGAVAVRGLKCRRVPPGSGCCPCPNRWRRWIPISTEASAARKCWPPPPIALRSWIRRTTAI
jgi:hypothetical protein